MSLRFLKFYFWAVLCIFVFWFSLFSQTKYGSRNAYNRTTYGLDKRFGVSVVPAVSSSSATPIENILPAKLIQYWTADDAALKQGWANLTLIDSIKIKAGRLQVGYVPVAATGDEPEYNTNVHNSIGGIHYSGATDRIREYPTTSNLADWKFLHHPDSSFTIMQIFKIASSNTNDFHWIFDNYIGTSFGIEMRYDDRSSVSHNDAVFLRIENNNVQWVPQIWIENKITGAVTHCLVLQWNGGILGADKVNFFLDNDLIAHAFVTASITPVDGNANDSMHIGNSSWASMANWFTGWVFEWAVWNGVASVTDIMADFDFRY